MIRLMRDGVASDRRPREGPARSSSLALMRSALVQERRGRLWVRASCTTPDALRVDLGARAKKTYSGIGGGGDSLGFA